MSDNENLHKNHRQRMMKKFTENGLDSFEPHEILEILLFNVFTRCNTNDISHRLLNEFKTIKGVLNASVNELASIKGIGEAAAVHICFLGEFYKFLARERADTIVLNSNDRVFEYCRELADVSLKEFFAILFLDRKNTLISKYNVNGHFDFVTPDKTAVLLKSIVPGCVSAVAVHNHPAGAAAASSADITSTHNLILFLKQLNIKLEDHLIICDGKYISMRNDVKLHKIWE